MVGPATKLAKLEPMAERMSEQEQDWETGWGCAIQEIDQSLSFVPVEPSEEPDPGSPRHLIPNRRIAVSDILPLTLSSGQVCQPFSSSILHPQPWQVSLGVDPTCSSLPISPIFIKTGGGVDDAEEGGEEGSLVTYGLLDSLEELPNIPTELLSLGKHQHMHQLTISIAQIAHMSIICSYEQYNDHACQLSINNARTLDTKKDSPKESSAVSISL